MIACGDVICSGGGDGLIKVWHGNTHCFICNLSGHRGTITALIGDTNSKTIYSSSTDGTVRHWDLRLSLCKRTLSGPSDVLCLALTRAVVVAGFANGLMHVINRWTYQVQLVLSAGPNPVHCVAVNVDLQLVLCGTSGGCIAAWHLADTLCVADAQPVASAAADVEEAILPSSCDLPLGVDDSKSKLLLTKKRNASELQARVTSDDSWQVSSHFSGYAVKLAARGKLMADKVAFHHLLRTFVGIPSISSSAAFLEECWRGARFIATTLELLGATVKTTASPRVGALPVVIAKFFATAAVTPRSERECVVVYAHYDVVFADPTEWDSDPFVMEGRDGYLYGRGVSDNKGPLLATIFAVKALLDSGNLNVDVCFVIEGEEESGLSLHERGFESVIASNLSWFKPCRAIVISNNYWIDEVTPCITYGMRGVIDLEIWVSGPRRDLHSGVDGGAVNEPMADLNALLASLHASDGSIAVQALNQNVRPPSSDEAARLESLNLDMESYASDLGVSKLAGTPRFGPSSSSENWCSGLRSASARLLARRWAQPHISISSIESTNRARAFRKIPMAAVARLSVHFVPDQEAEVLIQALREHLQLHFASRSATNRLSIVIKQTSDWWLGDINASIFQIAGRAVQDVWGVMPRMVREGGSYGGITAALEGLLQAPALHLPMGQSSDHAHLHNERISVHNLGRGQQVFLYAWLSIFARNA